MNRDEQAVRLVERIDALDDGHPVDEATLAALAEDLYADPALLARVASVNFAITGMMSVDELIARLADGCLEDACDGPGDLVETLAEHAVLLPDEDACRLMSEPDVQRRLSLGAPSDLLRLATLRLAR